MKKAMLFLLLPCLLLAACGRRPRYSDLLTPQELLSRAAPTGTDYLAAHNELLSDYLDLSSFPEGELRYSSDGNDLDEFGIWHLTDGRMGELSALLEDYLSESYRRNQAFFDSYIPKETPKLRDAEVRVMGNYVAYAVLSPDRREAFFSALREALTSAP